jgi:acetate kinase
MTSAPPCILTINGGSSSIRFAVHEAGPGSRRHLHGQIERIGLRGTRLIVQGAAGKSPLHRRVAATGHRTAVAALLQWLESQPVFTAIKAVGHRVVHGTGRAAPARVTPRLLAELRRARPYDPEHLPREIELIEAIRRRHPRLPQVACFDTTFHRTMPRLARLLPIPRSYAAKGVQRYGFHGLSYAYLLEELGRLDPASARGRIVLAHLGNGCSLAAVRHGASIDTSMGFTPTSGLMMGSRTGDLDPGLAYYLARTEGMTGARFQRMVNHDSGLLGVSGTSSDMRDLLARRARDPRAAEAIALFCYQVKKWIGAYAAALGGLDTLVFAGGIGENSPLIRETICEGLAFLGVELQRTRNARSSTIISKDRGPVRVRVIRTDEERMIARIVSRMLGVT